MNIATAKNTRQYDQSYLLLTSPATNVLNFREGFAVTFSDLKGFFSSSSSSSSKLATASAGASFSDSNVTIYLIQIQMILNNDNDVS